MRSIAILVLIALLPAPALADRQAADACAAELSAPSREIYDGSLAAGLTQANAREVVTDQTKKLLSEGKLTVLNARAAGQAAGRCLEMLQK